MARFVVVLALALSLAASGCTRRMAPAYAISAVLVVALAAGIDQGYHGDGTEDGIDLEGIPLKVGVGIGLALGVAALVSSSRPDPAPPRPVPPSLRSRRLVPFDERDDDGRQ